MKRLVPPSRANHDPLAGREWHGYTQGERILLDGREYYFYRYNTKTSMVEIEETHTRLLWEWSTTDFLTKAIPLTDTHEMVLFFNVYTEGTVNKRRQAARYQFMERLSKAHGYETCYATMMKANQWWPGTKPTHFELETLRREDERHDATLDWIARNDGRREDML